MSRGNKWTEERKELACTLWKDGFSAGQIAKELGGTTRNAVIGLVFRAGLTGLRMPRRSARVPKPIRRHVAVMKRLIAGLPDEEKVELPPPLDLSHAVDFYGLNDDHCRWPIAGEGYKTLFCGHQVWIGLPYCRGHCRMAYQPAQRPPRTSRKWREIMGARGTADQALADVAEFTEAAE